LSKDELKAVLGGVPGWLGHDEAWALREAARTHPADEPAITVVEIGSWKGRSTVALAHGLRARGGGTVYAIDPHRDTRLHRATGEVDTRGAFLANVRSAGVADRVQSICASSRIARANFADDSVHLLFVDGSHLYDDVVADIDAWTSALTDGAIVAFHDIHDEPDVARALHERVEPAESQFHDLRVVQNLLLTAFRRPRAAQATDSATGPSTAVRST
jgi:predicted O-methyltransferase YrrM